MKLRDLLRPLIVLGLLVFTLRSDLPVTPSKFFGWLAFSIAIGEITYLLIAAPYGSREHGRLLGHSFRYRGGAWPVVPLKVAKVVIPLVLLCCAISFGFYAAGQ